MEFSYQISERDYWKGQRIAIKAMGRRTVKTILLWALIVIGLILVFTIVTRNTQVPTNSASATYESSDSEEPGPPPSPLARTLLLDFGPLALILGVWIGLMFIWVPYAARKQYRKDPNQHGTMTVTLDRERFTLRSTVGYSSEAIWGNFSWWKEKNGMVVLSYPNRTFQFLNVAGLSELECQELRGILGEVLPEKK